MPRVVDIDGIEFETRKDNLGVRERPHTYIWQCVSITRSEESVYPDVPLVCLWQCIYTVQQRWLHIMRSEPMWQLSCHKGADGLEADWSGPKTTVAVHCKFMTIIPTIKCLLQQLA